jgi:cell division GTPase FtsZ
MKRRTFLQAMGGMAGLAITKSVPAIALPQEALVHKMVIVGLGGTGGRIVSRMASMSPQWWAGSDLFVEHYAIDTDHRSLDRVDASVQRILLSGYPQDSSGSCIYPMLARKAAWRHRDLFKGIWSTHGISRDPIVIFVAGFGRGAGTGLAQALSWQARQQNLYAHFPILAMPFSWEAHAVSLTREMNRLECAAEHGLCLHAPDESNPDEPMAVALEKLDRQIIQDITGSVKPWPT